MIKVSVVSYLNATPFVYGLKHYKFSTPFELLLDSPNICAQKLINNQIDIGLVPIAIIPQLRTPTIITDYCIGANGKVLSVQLFSNKPLHQIKTIGLDAESNTSNKLCKLLCDKHWLINPTFTNYSTTNDANIIIGDRALAALGTYAYEFDLAEAWQEYTNLPFVFAAWVSNKPIALPFVTELNTALALGVNVIPKLIATNYANDELVSTYLTQHICYNLGTEQKQAITQFLEYK
ncbi:MAG: menaquinone biosynthesis protein [Bacteroidia bacterium]|nr:menaquinone biosynthesis protein [Bacteroidia bacterium]